MIYPFLDETVPQPKYPCRLCSGQIWVGPAQGYFKGAWVNFRRTTQSHGHLRIKWLSLPWKELRNLDLNVRCPKLVVDTVLVEKTGRTVRIELMGGIRPQDTVYATFGRGAWWSEFVDYNWMRSKLAIDFPGRPEWIRT